MHLLNVEIAIAYHLRSNENRLQTARQPTYMAKKPIQQFELFKSAPEQIRPSSKVIGKDSDSPYIVYVDESGDHSLKK